MNRVQIIGRLGRDPEMRTSSGGTSVTQFSVAAERSYKKGQEWVNETEWVSVVAWGKLGERAAESLRRGGECYVEGYLKTRSWEGNDGQKRYKTELIAETVKPIATTLAEGGAAARGQAPGASDDLDNLPF